jgi:hypothetical protein
LRRDFYDQNRIVKNTDPPTGAHYGIKALNSWEDNNMRTEKQGTEKQGQESGFLAKDHNFCSVLRCATRVN